MLSLSPIQDRPRLFNETLVPTRDRFDNVWLCWSNSHKLVPTCLRGWHQTLLCLGVFLQKISLTSIICDSVVLCVYFAGCRVAAKAKVCPAARAETGKAGPKWCLAGPAQRASPEDTGIETPKLGWSWCYGRPGLGAMGEDKQHLEVPTKELRGDPANRDMILHQEGVSSKGKTVTSALQELSGLNTYQC